MKAKSAQIYTIWFILLVCVFTQTDNDTTSGEMLSASLCPILRLKINIFIFIFFNFKQFGLLLHQTFSSLFNP